MDLFGLSSSEDEDEKIEDTIEPSSMEQRLDLHKYNAEDCKDAIHGTKIPKALGLLVHQLCTIRGIRHHHGFAHELCGVTPEFTRALNARDIMSGIIPAMSQPEETPYCIWYPGVPKEDTLRALVQRYPDMLYHAARACAVAGYIDLYKELDPLPEVHVAEEAGYASLQKNNNGSQQIYQHILSQPLKFEIMNDYTRTVNIAGRRVAQINGDTAVHSSLTARSMYFGPQDRGHLRSPMPWNRFCRHPPYFNITEDWGIDDHDCEAPEAPEDYVPWIYTPVPADLPLINKDKLLYVAAYNGDIDRYARLRRPRMIKHEWAMVVRGIYHNEIFAKWWSTQIAEHPEDRWKVQIKRAINARRIMSDDLSWITVETPAEELPELIWYPNLAQNFTYKKLAHVIPAMFGECLRASIVTNCTHTWDDLLHAAPDIFKYTRGSSSPEDPKLWWLSKRANRGLWREAERSSNKHFQQDILAAMPDADERFRLSQSDWWGDWFTANDFYSRGVGPLVRLFDPVQPGSCEGPYNGMDCSVGDIGIALFLRDAISRETWKQEIEENQGFIQPPIEVIWDLLEASHIRE